MAAKPEDYRLSELFSKGSKAIDKTRDIKTGSILVRKKDGKQVPPGLSNKDVEERAHRIKKGKPVNHIQKQKPFVKYGLKPIRDIKKGDPAKYKSDWIDTDEFDIITEDQTKFSGETSGYLEKPKYNEEELKKALDVKVDELIKKQKPAKGPFILLDKYTRLQDRFDLKVGELELLRDLLNKEISANESLRTDVATLEVSMDSAQLQRAAAEDETEVANDRFAKLLADFQQSLIKGTKEGIERVSLTAQVRGLQAQKATLKELLEVQKGLVDQLTSQVSGAAAEGAAAAAGLVPFPGNEGYYGIKKDKPADWTDYDVSWTTSAKHRKDGKGGVMKIQNLRDDGNKMVKVTLQISGEPSSFPGKPFGFGSDSSPTLSKTVDIAQGTVFELPFFFKKSIGGTNQPSPKNHKWYKSDRSAKDYTGKFKIVVEFEDGTNSLTSSELTWKIRKNRG